MQTIELIYFNADGGHRAAAQALQTVLREMQPTWRVRCINLADLLDVKRARAVVRTDPAPIVAHLASHWQRTQPDMVVSLIPTFNRAMHGALAIARPGVPLVTVMTDLADHPSAVWIEPDLPNQHLVCGTDHAVLQALKAGCAPARVHRCSGMVLRPEFHRPLVLDRARERARLGLDPHRPTGVVMFGGHGSMTMLTIARQLHDVQLVLVCGHDAALVQRLRSLNPAAPQHVVGFTSDVRHHLALGDFFIGKPSPGSLSEALQAGLPVLTVRDAWTPPHACWNADWVRAQGVGLVGSSWHQMRTLVQLLLVSMPTYQAAVRRQENRAVFEVPGVLAEVFAQAQAGALQRGQRAATGAEWAEADGVLSAESFP